MWRFFVCNHFRLQLKYHEECKRKPVLYLKWKVTAKKAALEEKLWLFWWTASGPGIINVPLQQRWLAASWVVSQNAWGCKRPLEIYPLLKRDHIEQVVQDPVHLSFEYLQGLGTPQSLWAACYTSKSVGSGSKEVISMPCNPNPALLRWHLEQLSPVLDSTGWKALTYWW